MERFGEIRKRLLELAVESEDIGAIIEIGSQTREHEPADEFSDLDLILVSELPERYLHEDEAVCRLGKMLISFTEPTLAGATERRMLFAGSLDVDLVVITPEQLNHAVAAGGLEPILTRGFRVLFDRTSAAGSLPSAPKVEVQGLISAGEFWNTANDFWFHTVWTAKKLKRGELYTAVMCLDGYLQHLLLRVIELHEKCIHGESYDVWHNGRLLERWADGSVTERLKGCFARYDREDIASALNAAAGLYSKLARASAAALGYHYPDGAEQTARQILKELLAK